MSYFSASRRRFLLLGVASAGLDLLLHRPVVKATDLETGSLQLERLEGKAVLRLQGKPPLKAWLGARLWRVGEQCDTAVNSMTLWKLDSDMGYVNLMASSTMKLSAIARTVHGGRITELEVPRGQAHLTLRSFNNSESRFILRTPAGLASVTGTEFGISVQPDGKTGVATESGSVEVSAEGETVHVEGQQQTLIVPGESPLPASPLLNSADLKMDRAEQMGNQLFLTGKMDPVNLLTINGALQLIGADGRFNINLDVTGQQLLILQVTTPLGKQRAFQLPLGQRPGDQREKMKLELENLGL